MTTEKKKPKWLSDSDKSSGSSPAQGSSQSECDEQVQAKNKGKDDRILRLLRQTNNEVHSYSALIARRTYEDLTKDGL